MQNWWKYQLSNAFLYVPFLMAFGAALYFNLPTEPHMHFIIPTTVALGVLAVGIRRWLPLRAIIIFAFGFMYAMIFSHLLNTPQLGHNIRNTTVTANVVNIDFTNEKQKLFLRINSTELGGTGSDDMIVRVSINADYTLPNIGDTISANMTLFRPPVADGPETFDMARWMYFNGISATGFVTDYNVITPAKHTSINSIRAYIHNRANSPLVDSLVLGYKNSISSDDKTIWTTIGIGHVWAISGFHMALVGSWLFVIFMVIVRLISPITRRVPARKIAIIATCAGLFGYLLLSGASVSTIRAFLMTVLVGIAFIIGRSAFSLRNICLVFCIIFLINPSCIMNAGFQLSFAAVFGLVWFWNEVNPKMPANKILRWFSVAVITSVVATIFTAPFVIAHFNNLPLYGLIGNLVLLPVFSVAIMPLVLIGAIVACFGIYAPLNLAHNIYDVCLVIATDISQMPFANIGMPHIPNIAMVFIIIGFIVVILARPVRSYIQYIMFSVCVGIGIIITAVYPKPVFMTTADHELVAFMTDGKITFNKSRDSGHFFAFNTWRKLCGISPNDTNERYPHDHGVYLYSTPNFNLAYIQKFVPLQNNIVKLCRDDSIKYIVTYFDINAPKCNHKILRNGFIIYPSGRIKYTPMYRPWHYNRR